MAYEYVIDGQWHLFCFQTTEKQMIENEKWVAHRNKPICLKHMNNKKTAAI